MAVQVRDFVVETVCTMPPGRTADAVTSDGHVVSFWPRPEGKFRFAWDGHAEHTTFDGIVDMRDKSRAIFASADGAHIAYVGMRDDHMFVGRDAGEDPPVEAFSRSVPPVFSRDGRHLAYGGGTLEEYRLILDGHPIGEYPLAPTAAVFSPDGERLAYVEMRGEKRATTEIRIVLDGVPGEWFPGMRNAGGVMQFSPDSQRFAYCRMDGDLHVQWVVDGVAQQLFDEVVHLGLSQIRGIGVLEPPLLASFSPDSRRFAYFADIPEKGVAIVEDDVAGPRLKAIGALAFSPDSRHLAYTAMTLDDRLTVVVDGVVGPPFAAKDAGTPVFSADGRHTAVTVKRKAGRFLRRRNMFGVAVDGRVVTELQGDDTSMIPALSPDGERVAWWLQQGKVRRMYVNGTPDQSETRAESDPVFTAAGHLAYVARVGTGGSITVVVDGRPGFLAEDLAANRSVLDLFGRDLAPSRDVPFAVSPDGEHVAWMGKFEGEWRPILDDQVGPAFEMPLAWSFDAAGVATWYAQRGDVVYRVTAEG